MYACDDCILVEKEVVDQSPIPITDYFCKFGHGKTLIKPDVLRFINVRGCKAKVTR